jgi:hypothetical protein
VDRGGAVGGSARDVRGTTGREGDGDDARVLVVRGNTALVLSTTTPTAPRRRRNGQTAKCVLMTSAPSRDE